MGGFDDDDEIAATALSVVILFGQLFESKLVGSSQLILNLVTRGSDAKIFLVTWINTNKKKSKVTNYLKSSTQSQTKKKQQK